MTAVLAEVAGWDLPLLRGSVGTLTLVAGRLPPWRARLEQVGRGLAAAECWSGPAGDAAAAALDAVAEVTWAVQRALADSAHQLQAAVPAADDAQRAATAALARASAAGVALAPDGGLPGLPAPATSATAPDQRAALDEQRDGARVAGALAGEALAAAGRVAAAATRAAEPLAGLGEPAGAPAVSFADLLTRVGAAPPGPVPALPADRDPARVARWWSELPPAGREALLAGEPAALGALDGLPGWARDRANRAVLAGDLRYLPPGSPAHATAAAVADELAARDRDGGTVQLLEFDPLAGLVSLSLGDVDTAGAVAVLVPGIENTPTDDLPQLTGDAHDVAAAATAAAPGLAVATVVWLGYRTPRWATALSERSARSAGPVLDRALDGLAASRAVPGAPPAPRTTVLAHSYGTLVTSRAARAPGRLAADAVVLLGSPGVEAWRAGALEADEVYGASSAGDWIAQSGAFGSGPGEPWFGDVELPTEPDQRHSDYYDRDRPTLAAIGRVVAGTRVDG